MSAAKIESQQDSLLNSVENRVNSMSYDDSEGHTMDAQTYVRFTVQMVSAHVRTLIPNSSDTNDDHNTDINDIEMQETDNEATDDAELSTAFEKDLAKQLSALLESRDISEAISHSLFGFLSKLRSIVLSAVVDHFGGENAAEQNKTLDVMQAIMASLDGSEFVQQTANTLALENSTNFSSTQSDFNPISGSKQIKEDQPPLSDRVKSALYTYFQIAHWLPKYTKKDLVADLQAGLTIGVMLIPQGLAYALLAQMPPIYGLYTSFVPLLMYTLFGTSRQISVGPTALMSLLVASSVSLLAEPGTDEFVGYALVLALMVGIIETVMGLLHLGVVVNFLSHPVVSGFTSASALIIGASQLKHLFGVSLPPSHGFLEQVYFLAAALPETNWIPLVIGIVATALLLTLKKFPQTKKLPGGLILVVLGTIVGYLVVGLGGASLKIVGSIPAGLPVPIIPKLDGQAMSTLLAPAFIIAMIGFLESVAVAKRFASKHEYELDSNQELLGLGMANLVGSFFLSFPNTGGFSRSAVNDSAGARTSMSQVFAAIIVMMTLLFLTPLFYFLPKTVLAAMILAAVKNLFNISEPKELWHTSRKDFYLLVSAFLFTLIIGVEEGILIAMFMSLAMVILAVAKPHHAILGRLGNSIAYRNIARFPDAITFDHMVILRIDASLYFFNSDWIRTRFEKIEARTTPKLKTLIIDAGPISAIDSVAVHTLRDIAEDYKERGLRLVFAEMTGPVRDMFKDNEMVTDEDDSPIRPNQLYLTLHDAVVSEWEQLAARLKTEREQQQEIGDEAV